MIDIYSLPVDDLNVYKLFHDGATTGIFQFSSSEAKHLCKAIKPVSIDDLAIINALNRPSGLDSGMAEDFVARRQGLKLPETIHPIVDAIGKSTLNVFPYQEQLVEICVQLADFTYSQAFDLLKAIKKKSAEMLGKFKEHFISHASKKCSLKTATDIWEMVEKWALYGFNRSHSIAYSYLGYITAYFKCYHPLEFYCANMTEEAYNGDTERLFELIREANQRNIRIIPPDIRWSKTEFAIQDDSIVYGLKAVKGLGEKGLELLFDNEPAIGYCNLEELKFCNVLTFAGLLRCGALDALDFKLKAGLTRKQKLSLFKTLKHSKAEAEVGNPGLQEQIKAFGFILTQDELFKPYKTFFDMYEDDLKDLTDSKLDKFEVFVFGGILIDKRPGSGYKKLFILTPKGTTWQLTLDNRHTEWWGRDIPLGTGLCGMATYLEDNKITINNRRTNCYLKTIEDFLKE